MDKHIKNTKIQNVNVNFEKEDCGLDIQGFSEEEEPIQLGKKMF